MTLYKWLNFGVKPVTDVDLVSVFHLPGHYELTKAFYDISHYLSYSDWWIFTKLSEIIDIDKRTNPSHFGGAQFCVLVSDTVELTVIHKNLAVANRSRVSCAHNTSRALPRDLEI